MKKFHPGHSSAHPRPYNRIPSLAARQVSYFMKMMALMMMMTTMMTTMTMTPMMTMITMMTMMMMMIRGRVEEAALILDTAATTNGRKGASKVSVITHFIIILVTIIIIILFTILVLTMVIIGTPRLD